MGMLLWNQLEKNAKVYDSQIGKIITEQTKSNSKVVISEAQLRNIIKESIKKVLNII